MKCLLPAGLIALGLVASVVSHATTLANSGTTEEDRVLARLNIVAPAVSPMLAGRGHFLVGLEDSTSGSTPHATGQAKARAIPAFAQARGICAFMRVGSDLIPTATLRQIFPMTNYVLGFLTNMISTPSGPALAVSRVTNEVIQGLGMMPASPEYSVSVEIPYITEPIRNSSRRGSINALFGQLGAPWAVDADLRASDAVSEAQVVVTFADFASQVSVAQGVVVATF